MLNDFYIFFKCHTSVFMFIWFLIFIIFRLFADKDDSKSENTASRISTQSKHSTREEFLNKLQVKNIVELLDVDQVTLYSCA